ncbi:MAG: hypothetical protein R2838_10545 [Caldilineaceae bacterium]
MAEAASGVCPEHGYIPGDPKDYDRQYAVDRLLFWRFLPDATQPDEPAKPSPAAIGTGLFILDRLDRKLKRDGVISCSRTGWPSTPISPSSTARPSTISTR